MDSPPRGQRPWHTLPQHTLLRHTRPYQMVASKYNGQPTARSNTAAHQTAAYHTASDGGIQVKQTAHMV